MRCASHACEAAIRAMEDSARCRVADGTDLSEDDIWAVLHAREHQTRRRVDRDPPTDLWTAHQPLVSGMRRTDGPANERDRQLSTLT